MTRPDPAPPLPNLSAGSTGGAPPLGWPWDQVRAALERWVGARLRHHAAVVRGDVNARESAQMEMWEAEQDRAGVRDRVAQEWLMGFRCAMELYPEAVAALLDELVKDVPPAAGVVEAITELEDRVDAAEDAVVELERDRVYR